MIIDYSVHSTGKLVKALKDRGNKTEVLGGCEREDVNISIFRNWFMQSCTVKRTHRINLAITGKEDVLRDFSFLYLKLDGCTQIL